MKARPAASIEVSRLRKQFGAQGVLAIEDVSLSIAPGEFVSVLGPSGCGKSTLLRCIAGLETPTSGSVQVNAAPVTVRRKDSAWCSSAMRCSTGATSPTT